MRVNEDILAPYSRESLQKHKLGQPSGSLSLLSCTTASTPNLIDHEDVMRIQSGDETRTTLMIKQIPRRYTLELLRREIDRTLGQAGLYDLLYLPVGMDYFT